MVNTENILWCDHNKCIVTQCVTFYGDGISALYYMWYYRHIMPATIYQLTQLHVAEACCSVTGMFF